jgi:hypothetical protein
MIGYHKTMTPLSIKMDVRSQRYNHVTMRDLGVFIRMEGIAPRIVDKIKSLTRIGQLKVDELKQLLINDMNIRQRDDIPAKLDIALMMRDQVVLNYHLEDREVMNVMEGIRDYIMSFTSYEALFRFNRHFSIVWDKLHIEVPTDFGVPMAYKMNAMTLVGLMGEMKKQNGIKADLKLNLHWHTFNTEKMFTIHPQNNIRFAIQQDRVFKHQLTTAARAEVDLETRRLAVSLIVPEQEAPLSWLGHSQTYLITRENKIAERQTLLKKSCPTCETPLIVSRGKEQRRNVELIDNYRQYMNIYGLNVDAKLFDCELREAQSFGQAYKNLLQSFNPATKEPRNFFNVIFSGLRQLRNYLFYFPRVESCGINLVLARSSSDPVK